MAKAFRDEAAVSLPRVSNNPPEADHGSLPLAHRVKSFQDIETLWTLQIPTIEIIQDFH